MAMKEVTGLDVHQFIFTDLPNNSSYQADKNLEEMADMLEVLQAICLARGYSLEELEVMRLKKAVERGGFSEKIFLEYIE